MVDNIHNLDLDNAVAYTATFRQIVTADALSNHMLLASFHCSIYVFKEM